MGKPTPESLFLRHLLPEGQRTLPKRLEGEAPYAEYAYSDIRRGSSLRCMGIHIHGLAHASGQPDIGGHGRIKAAHIAGSIGEGIDGRLEAADVAAR